MTYKIQAVIKKGIALTIGVVLTAIALEEFLVPNNIIDGGIVGISIISSYLSNISLGFFLFTLNIPFLIFAYQRLGQNFIISSAYSVTLLSILVHFFHNLPNATEDLLLACIFGGIILGAGVGLILRNNGSLDGTEMIAIQLAKKVPFSVGEIIMFFNVFILSSAGFVFGWDRAMYSLIAYFITYKTIDVVIAGIDESKSITIISDNPDMIADVILHELGRGVTFIEGKGAYTGNYKKIIYCIITRLELTRLKQVVFEHDPKAFIAIENVHEVEGGQVKKSRF
ncbi:MAG: YitT family protein [Candidatus Gastranaerophilales bacterium]|nr:YitT family protein [Candidatus Gastranaerophilales bacterium]